MASFCVVGSINTDIVTTVDNFPEAGQTISGSSFEIFRGGKGANQAVAIARLSGKVEMLAAIGDDIFGVEYLKALREEGVGVDGISILPGTKTGTASIEVSSLSGQNHIIVVAGANAGLTPERVRHSRNVIEHADFTLLQLEIPIESAIEAAQIARSANKVVILDPAPARPLPAELAHAISIITPNETEAKSLTGIDTSTEEGIHLAGQRLLSLGIGTVVVKAGSRGAFLFRNQEKPIRIPGFPVKVIDTVAAGDSFNGGLAVALGQGMPIESAIRYANAVGGLSTTMAGAQSAMPDKKEVDAFLSNYTS